MTVTKVFLGEAGYCLARLDHAEYGSPKKTISFGALFALILHPQAGYILFDTGYTQRFYQATSSYPNRIYANITKVFISPMEEVKSQLEMAGVNLVKLR